jgi:PAS domain S-box-containing protein
MIIEPGSARVLFANRAAHRLAGGAFPLAQEAAEYFDRYPSFDETGRRLGAHEMPAVRAAAGEMIDQERVDWETPLGRRSLIVSSAAVEGLVTVTFEDVTELEAQRRRAALLSEAGAVLSTSLDYEERLRALARLVLPRLADWCVVVQRRPDGSLQRVVGDHALPGLAPLVAQLEERWALDPAGESGTPRVIRTGRAELHADAAGLLAAMAREPEHRDTLTALGFGSAVLVPLLVRGTAVGSLGLFAARTGRYDEADLATAQALADRCAVLLENARLYSEQQAILSNIAEAVTAQTTDGHVVFANEAAVRLFGFPDADTMLATPPAELRARVLATHEDGRPVDPQTLPARRAMRGEEPEPLTVRFRRPDGSPGWARIKAQAVRDSEATPLAINVIEDITELKEAEQGQRFLAEASRVLGSSLDYEQTLRAIAHSAVPEIADWCGVDLAADGAIEHVVVAHSDPAKLALARELRERFPVDPDAPTGVPEVLRTGRSQLHPHIPDALLEASIKDPEHLALMRSVGMVSALIVPMTLRDRVLGAITFVSAESGRRYDEQDLVLAEALGRRAAVAVDNARLYRTRSAIAHTLQASLLPPVLPDIPGMDVGAAYRAAGEGFDVGGDFYDLFAVDDDHWFVVVGDVCGKGAEAAAVTALARYTIRAAAARRRSPAAILRWVNEAMLKQEDAGRFATIACAQIDLSRTPARVTVACGGHPLPLVLRADGGVCEAGAPGMLVGLVESIELQERTVELRTGDTLVLYTDGLTEAGAPERVWAPEDLEDALRGASGESAQGVVAHLLAQAVPDPHAAPRDDVALLALQVRPEPAS